MSRNKLTGIIVACIVVVIIVVIVVVTTTPRLTPAPTTLAGVGEWVNLTSDVRLGVKEIADDHPSILVTWSNDGGVDFVLECQNYTVISGADVYAAVNLFAPGAIVKIAPGKEWTWWLQFPEEAMPLQGCILQYDGLPIFDLSIRAE